MYDPTMRVLTVLEMLQARERVSGRELAGRLEVSVRTVQRYVVRLQDLGVPVHSTRGPGGAYRLKPGFRMPPLMLGTEEAFALALGLDALSYLGLGEIAAASSGARAKLARVMPVTVAAQVSAVRAALLLDRPRWIVNADVETLVELAMAVHASRRVRMEYISSEGGKTSRAVEPLGLIQHEGRWFLAAFCLLRGDERLFRVDRIRSLESLVETFEAPAGFDLRAFLYERMALVAAPWEVEVWVGASPEFVESKLPRAFAVLTGENGGTRLQFTSSNLEESAMRLLAIGRPLSIVSPIELRDGFRVVSERAMEVAEGPPHAV